MKMNFKIFQNLFARTLSQKNEKVDTLEVNNIITSDFDTQQKWAWKYWQAAQALSIAYRNICGKPNHKVVEPFRIFLDLYMKSKNQDKKDFINDLQTRKEEYSLNIKVLYDIDNDMIEEAKRQLDENK